MIRRVTRTRGPHYISRHGLDFLIREEGCVLHPYNDAVGNATVGVGHLIHHGPVTTADRQHYAGFSLADARALLRSDINNVYASAVNKLVRVPLSQAEFDMLVSLTFNIGVGGFQSSRVLRELNAHHRYRAKLAFLGWSNAGGRPILRGRRLRESYRFGRARWS